MSKFAVKSQEIPTPAVVEDQAHLYQVQIHSHTRDYIDQVERMTLRHRELLEALAETRSTKELVAHPKYREGKKVIEEALSRVEYFPPPQEVEPVDRESLRVVAWNIERGMAYDGILESLQEHPVLADNDVVLLTEVDFGMARSGNRHIARELGFHLNRYTVFGPAFLNIDKGNGSEVGADGENTVAMAGHAILSRYPIDNVELVELPNPKDFMSGQERRIGVEKAIIATIRSPKGPVDVACVHLSAHSSRRHRAFEIFKVVTALSKRHHPALIGGDFNTHTYNAHQAQRAILGFWRRVLMGVRHVMRNHYPYPERYFEKELFELMRKHGFEIDKFNIPGGCTIHYDFNDPYIRLSLGDWVPDWCFPFMDWALKPFNGKISFKLDWFAGRGLSAERPVIVQDLPKGLRRYSDHDPIMVDVVPSKEKS